jgi:hypothetical protein
MEFYQKYELLDLLKDEGVKVFNAREISTGRRIAVFLFVGEQARLHAELLEQLRASLRPDRTDLLEVGDNQGIPFVVTEPLGGMAELKRKVAVSPAPPAAAQAGRPPDAFTSFGVRHVPAPTPSGARGATPVTPLPPAATAPPAHSAPGEFTRLFQPSAPPQPIGEAAPLPPPPTHAPPPAATAPPAQSAAGEFTRLFQPSAPPQPIGEAVPPPPPPTQARPPAATAPPAQSAAGEFTRLFQPSAPPPPLPPTHAPLPPPAAPPAQAGAGEFTQFFQSPLSQARASEPVFPPPPAGAPQKPSPPAVPPSSTPGEFTRIFGRGDAPAAPPAPRAGGSATLSFRARPEFTPLATPAPSAGPGEYTQLFGAQPVLQPQRPAPLVAQTPAPVTAPVVGKKVPWLMLALIVAVVVLLAIVAIMAFAPRK